MDSTGQRAEEFGRRGRGGWLFSPYKGYSLAGVRARERHQEPQLRRKDATALHRTQSSLDHLWLSQQAPRGAPFSQPGACTTASSCFALCTSCIFKQQFLGTELGSPFPVAFLHKQQIACFCLLNQRKEKHANRVIFLFLLLQ